MERVSYVQNEREQAKVQSLWKDRRLQSENLYNASTRCTGGVGMCLMLHMINFEWLWNRTFKLMAPFLQ